jgi:hypothetical protein
MRAHCHKIVTERDGILVTMLALIRKVRNSNVGCSSFLTHFLVKTISFVFVTYLIYYLLMLPVQSSYWSYDLICGEKEIYACCL